MSMKFKIPMPPRFVVVGSIIITMLMLVGHCVRSCNEALKEAGEREKTKPTYYARVFKEVDAEEYIQSVLLFKAEKQIPDSIARLEPIVKAMEFTVFRLVVDGAYSTTFNQRLWDNLDDTKYKLNKHYRDSVHHNLFEYAPPAIQNNF